MWPFKRQEPLPDEPYIEPRVVKRELVKEWDVAAAKYVYILYEETEFTPHVVEQKWFLGGPVGPSRAINGEPTTIRGIAGSGGYAWAQRIAKHYKLKVSK